MFVNSCPENTNILPSISACSIKQNKKQENIPFLGKEKALTSVALGLCTAAYFAASNNINSSDLLLNKCMQSRLSGEFDTYTNDS